MRGFAFRAPRRVAASICVSALALLLASCGGVPVAYRAPAYPPPAAPASPASGSAASATVPAAAPSANVPGTLVQGKARWIPVNWNELPGWEQDPLFDAWGAWVRGCEKPVGATATLCPEVRRLSIASAVEQRAWMRQRLQPYRIESQNPQEGAGLLTGYFEPQLEASRQPVPGLQVPLYQVPRNLTQRKPWYTRQEIDTLPEAQAALRDRVIGYVADPIDALVLQIQGSGRIRMTEPGGQTRMVRLAYAGSNDQPYRSVGRWLLDQGLVRDASWPGIKAWLAQNPQRAQELLWSNPRYVFFREEPLPDVESGNGPRGSQGVPLTPGRSIAVDPTAIPYGTPVWLVSSGPQTQLQKLVMAQDSGSAIAGAVRADYFAGWGPDAADLAGRLRQPLQMWVLWPKPVQ